MSRFFFRSRGRNITSETFVCMHRAQPMFVEQKGNLSMYSNWHQVRVVDVIVRVDLRSSGSEEHAKLCESLSCYLICRSG